MIGWWSYVPWICGATLLVFVVMKFTVGTRGIKVRPGYLCMVVGLRGHGKSLFVARLIAERLHRGMPVYANFTVKGGVARMESWQDVIMAPRGSTVVLDEAHQWAGARAGSTLRPAAVWYVSQCRKLGHEVWVIAQHESMIASAVREQVNEIVECRKHVLGRHRATSWPPHEFRKRDARHLWAWWYSPRGRAIEVYDTLDLVPPTTDRKASHEDDVEMIVRCIAAIRARDAAAALPPPSDDELVSAWLDRASAV